MTLQLASNTVVDAPTRPTLMVMRNERTPLEMLAERGIEYFETPQGMRDHQALYRGGALETALAEDLQVALDAPFHLQPYIVQPLLPVDY